jgi:hypothetical protein
MMQCFTQDALHHSPSGMYDGTFHGAAKIAARWKASVENFWVYWTIDALLIEERKSEATIEWTHFKANQGSASWC